MLLFLLGLACAISTDKDDLLGSVTDGTDPDGGAACEVDVPGDAEMVSGETATSNSANAEVLVCSSGAATVNGAGSSVYVEAGGTATINGSDSTVWVQQSGAVSVNATGVLVYYEDAGDVTSPAIAFDSATCSEVVFVGGC